MYTCTVPSSSVCFYIIFSLLVLAAHASLGTFSTSPLALNTPRDSFCLVTYNDYTYAIGGYIGDREVGSIEYSTLTPAGALTSSFVTLASSLNVGREAAVCVVVPPFIYVIGGENQDGPLSSIEYTTIHADGTLSAFTVSAITFPVTNPQVATYDAQTSSVFYIAGAATYRSAVDANGALGVPTLLTSTLLQDDHSRVIQLGRSLIALGGESTQVEKATIHNDGTLSAFTLAASLTENRNGLSIGYANGVLYAVAGLTSGTGARPLSTVESALVDENGNFAGNFAIDSGVTLITGRLAHEGGVFGNQLVVIGGAATVGADILTSIEVAPLGPTTSPTPTPTPAPAHTIELKVLSSTNVHHLGLKVERDNGHTHSVEIRQAGSRTWEPMALLSGEERYSYRESAKLAFPISVKLISRSQTLNFADIIPNKKPTTYDTHVQYADGTPGKRSVEADDTANFDLSADEAAAASVWGGNKRPNKRSDRPASGCGSHTPSKRSVDTQNKRSVVPDTTSSEDTYASGNNLHDVPVVQQMQALYQHEVDTVRVIIRDSVTPNSLSIGIENSHHTVKRAMLRFNPASDWIAMKSNKFGEFVFPSEAPLSVPISLKLISKRDKIVVLENIITSLEVGSEFQSQTQF